MNYNTTSITEQLKQMGYTIEMQSPIDDFDIFFAKSQDQLNLYMRSGKGVLHVRSLWGGFRPSALQEQAFYHRINEHNQRLLLLRCHYEQVEGDANDLTIVGSALYFGYEKVTFTKFLDLFLQENRAMINNLQEFIQPAPTPESQAAQSTPIVIPPATAN